MKQVTTVGIDLAQNVFTLHGVDAAGNTVLRKTVRREKVMELVAALPALAREAIADLRAHLAYLGERISGYERQLIGLAKQHEPARRIQDVCGVGQLTASIASGHEFLNGRQFAAWLGLVPRQYST